MRLLLLVINGHSDFVEFTLPECYGGMQWSLLVDTNIADSSEKGTFAPGISTVLPHVRCCSLRLSPTGCRAIPCEDDRIE